MSRGKATAVAADISSEAECLKLVEAARAAYGPDRHLGEQCRAQLLIPTVDYPTNRWIKAFAVNVHAPFTLSKAVLPDMIAAGRGAIVNISSGRRSVPAEVPTRTKRSVGASCTAPAKAALERFTQGLGQEVAHHGGIAVSCVSPSAGRADARHGLSQAGRRPRRSTRRAAFP